MTKFVFVTGGVVSSLGKGIAAASLAALLEARGLRVTLIKIDPYINIDPGTMSPFQHGEVFVTEDGAETDLDLGHYERFVRSKMRRTNNFTTGQIYQSVIDKERKGVFLGKTVQVIPHVTDEIIEHIESGARLSSAAPCDIAICEIGGTVGDIESLPFIEAIRQMRIRYGKDHTCFIHLTLCPFIKSAGELKTKPTQHSVQKLREAGIFADALLCRSEMPLSVDIRSKIALFTNVPTSCVLSVPDAFSVYEVPLILHEQGLDDIVLDALKIKAEPGDLSVWKKVVKSLKEPSRHLKVAFVGKYVDYADSYKSLCEAMVHASIATNTKIDIKWVEAETLEAGDTSPLLDVDGILVPGGFGNRGIEGMIRAVTFARENRVPFLGICLGLQVATIEFARNVAGLEGANSTEFEPACAHPVISLVEREILQNKINVRALNRGDMGGTLRLGAQSAKTMPETLARGIYGENFAERHRHRYEVNPAYIDKLRSAGLVFSAFTQTGELTEMIEIADHPFFVASQFHPEFTSNALDGHPLFKAFAQAMLAHAQKSESLS